MTAVYLAAIGIYLIRTVVSGALLAILQSGSRLPVE